MREANIHDSRFEDFVQGDKIITEKLSSLEKAIDSIVKKHGNDSHLIDIFEELAEYLTANPDRKVIGLEEKLKAGNRTDLTEKAIKLKNRFDRRITKKQLSPVVQKVHLQVLTSIITAFDSKVLPLILKQEEEKVVDAAVYDNVILPAHKAIIRFNDLITTEDVRGMLYFLTGKCHVAWS